MANYTDEGILVSLLGTDAVMKKIATNYNGCKNNGTLHELLYGKWSKSYKKLIDECIAIASRYLYEAVTEDCFIDDSILPAMIEEYRNLIKKKESSIKTAIFHGDMELLKETTIAMHAEFMNCYWKTINAGFKAKSEV